MRRMKSISTGQGPKAALERSRRNHLQTFIVVGMPEEGVVTLGLGRVGNMALGHFYNILSENERRGRQFYSRDSFFYSRHDDNDIISRHIAVDFSGNFGAFSDMEPPAPESVEADGGGQFATRSAVTGQERLDFSGTWDSVTP